MAKGLLVETDQPVLMRDGIILRADVYRPAGDRRYPVLLARTPYGKSFTSAPFALLAAKHGYAVVIQDTRGRWASEGEGYPFVSEREDGYDTLEWTASQSWSSGHVGMFGSSYVGYTQWAAASGHPALKTIIPAVSFCNPHHFAYQGGVLKLGTVISWALMAQAAMFIERFDGLAEQKESLWEQWVGLVDGMARGDTFLHLPLRSIPMIGEGGITPFFTEILKHPDPDDVWKSVRIPCEEIQLPVLHIASWYDLFLEETLQAFQSLQEEGSDEWIRLQQRLIIGPWVHGQFESHIGEVDFGLNASWILFLPEETQLRWFDYWLRGAENGAMEEPPVRYFLMGANRWMVSEDWPPVDIHPMRMYLHSSGEANTRFGDGSLSTATPEHEPADHFLYDPEDPVPTRGGSLCCWDPAMPPGAFDQRAIEERPDVLVYTSEPFGDDLDVTGPVRAVLWVTTSARDTDFTGKLVDVSPDGFARNLVDGILRLSSMAGMEGRSLREGEVVSIALEIGSTANRFLAGHRIRLEVSSSNFPRFDRNLNTGLRSADSSATVVAKNSVFHDTRFPSHLELLIRDSR